MKHQFSFQTHLPWFNCTYLTILSVVENIDRHTTRTNGGLSITTLLYLQKEIFITILFLSILLCWLLTLIMQQNKMNKRKDCLKIRTWLTAWSFIYTVTVCVVCFMAKGLETRISIVSSWALHTTCVDKYHSRWKLIIVLQQSLSQLTPAFFIQCIVHVMTPQSNLSYATFSRHSVYNLLLLK